MPLFLANVHTGEQVMVPWDIIITDEPIESLQYFYKCITTKMHKKVKKWNHETPDNIQETTRKWRTCVLQSTPVN